MHGVVRIVVQEKRNAIIMEKKNSPAKWITHFLLLASVGAVVFNANLYRNGFFFIDYFVPNGVGFSMPYNAGNVMKLVYSIVLGNTIVVAFSLVSLVISREGNQNLNLKLETTIFLVLCCSFIFSYVLLCCAVRARIMMEYESIVGGRGISGGLLFVPIDGHDINYKHSIVFAAMFLSFLMSVSVAFLLFLGRRVSTPSEDTTPMATKFG